MNTQLESQETQRRLAFTKLELLVVIAVIALLIGILLPALPKPHRRSKASTNLSNLRQIGIMVMFYAIENGDYLPSHPRYLAPYFPESMSQRDIFLSPYQDKGAVLDRGEPDGNGFRYGGYIFLGLGTSMEDIAASQTIIAYTARVSPNQIKRGVLFADGHAAQLEEDVFHEALPEGVDVDVLDGP